MVLSQKCFSKTMLAFEEYSIVKLLFPEGAEDFRVGCIA